ncbi:MAG TPA: hypothetical protein VH208_13605, partial [Myxococcaceae bacterium]|nr:hypothetical protein [Myxococcaceae bacterium]
AEEAVVHALSVALRVPRVHPAGEPRDGGALAKLDAEFCEAKGVFPIALRDNGKTLHLAMADPSDLELVDEVERRARARITIAIAGEIEIRTAIDRHYHHKEPAAPPKGAAGRPQAAPEPERLPPPVASSTNDDLEDLLGGGAGGTRFTREEVERIRAVAENQEKSGKVLRAVTELLIEKGYLSAKDLASRHKG